MTGDTAGAGARGGVGDLTELALDGFRGPGGTNLDGTQAPDAGESTSGGGAGASGRDASGEDASGGGGGGDGDARSVRDVRRGVRPDAGSGGRPDGGGSGSVQDAGVAAWAVGTRAEAVDGELMLSDTGAEGGSSGGAGAGDSLGGGSLSGIGAGGAYGGRRLPSPGAGLGPSSGSGAEGADGARRNAGRRGAADPVKTLMHRHRELCERAVDSLEIAAGLEAHGVTDRTAARFRHRDVFSLAEEMYARVARDGEAAAPDVARPAPPGTRPYWAVLALVPGALGAGVVAGLRLTHGQPRLAIAAFGALAVAFGLRLALRRGPLSSSQGMTGATLAWTCWLVAYALLGDGLLYAGLTGGPDGNWPLATAPVLALSLACAPAAWCAHLFVSRARRRLTTSRGLEEFAASVQPLLLGVFGLFVCMLLGLLALCGEALDEPPAYAGAGALGALLLLARLLTARGFTHAPALALAGAGTAEAAALATVYAARLPGCSFLATPVDTLVHTWGAGAVPALVCGAGAVVLLLHASRTLTRASAHARTGDAP
ncbi:hypothetical protein ACFYRN_07465 [Streptomyces sp. NPDC005227]|uniref:hypothetical protein n=1 Tax=Streptomyces sp. NPDC005227 TaxID=3364707 RepID=UPI003677C994